MSAGKKTKKTKRWVPTIGAKLGPQEQRLRNVLTEQGSPIGVARLFKHITGHGFGVSLRQMHQRVGAVAARHNRKVKTPHIVKGDKAGTYRLKRVR